MKLSEQLDKDTKNKLHKISNPKQKKKKRNVERFSEKDLLDLMGVNRDRYERHGGAIRKK